MFICTANITHPIPPALRDRMEILRLAGYTLFEKIKIAQRFLVPKQLKNHGLDPKKFTIEEEAIQDIIEKYTREAGVRNLERELASICRKLARRVVKEGKDYTFTVKSEQINDLLGVPRYRPSTSDKKNEIGIATGLAWTETGGEILTTEATLMKGRGKVLPIGGVKEKVLAAHRLGIRTIILPRDNEKDLADIPEDIQKLLEFKLVETMDEVLQYALERGGQAEVEKEYNKDLDKGIPGTVAH